MVAPAERTSFARTAPPTVLVTGGCGFIGANLVPRLVAEGYRVRVLDDLSVGRPESLAGSEIEIVQGSVCDAEMSARAVEGCFAVVHLAALSSVLESVADPRPTFDVNAGGTLNMLQASARAGVTRFVLASSNAALGEHQPPLHEGMVPRPISPYGASKLTAEAYCMAFFGSHGLGTVALRFSNVYGPHSGHKTSVVAKFIRSIQAGQPLSIYGDGRQTRDFIYVADVADAILAALRSDVAGEVLQIGTGRETTVLDLVQLLGEVTGVEPRLDWLDQPPGEIRRNFVSIERARQMLGFQPVWELRPGLDATVAWLTRNREPQRAAQREGVADD